MAQVVNLITAKLRRLQGKRCYIRYVTLLTITN